MKYEQMSEATLWDWYAGQALSGLVADERLSCEEAAEFAEDCADAMMRHRESKQQDDKEPENEIVFGVVSDPCSVDPMDPFVYISPKDYWEETGYMYDQSLPGAMKVLNELRLYEARENIYEQGSDMHWPEEELREKVGALPGFTHDPDFEKFVQP